MEGELAADQFSYDALLWPTNATTIWQGGSGQNGTIFSQGLSYDPASNLVSLTSTQNAVGSSAGGSETQNFCYDEQNRLVWAGNSGTQPAAGHGTCGSGTLSNSLAGANYNTSFVSTHLGQLWQGPLNGGSTQEQYLYCSSSQPHQLTGLYATGATCSSKSGQVYGSSYDAWGNVTSRSITNGTTLLSYTLSYDGLDHLVRWNDTQTTTNEEWYLYDASGNRVLKRSATGTGTSNTKIILYPFGLQEHTYDGAGTLQFSKYYYRLGGHLVGKSDGSATSFFVTDALGSVLANFSAKVGSAALLGNQTYGPYGSAQYQKGTLGTSKGFTGQYNDALTTLDYYGSRYYDPSVGVFLSAESALGNGSGENPYAYVGGNPETWSDPSGRLRIIAGGGGGSSGNSLVPFTPPVLSSGSSNTNAVQPCLAVGCVGAAKVGAPVWVAQQSRTLINVLAFVCGQICLIVPTTVSSTTITWYLTHTESSVVVCGLPYPCGDNRSESIGESGHDVPEGSFADAGAGSDPGGAAGNASDETSPESEGRPVNSKGVPYPKVIDPRTGEEMPFPEGEIQRVPREDRVTWDSSTDRYNYIKEWHDSGYDTPEGGWDIYDIHHILPKEFGGTNDWDNLVPVLRTFHNEVVTPWWNALEP